MTVLRALPARGALPARPLVTTNATLASRTDVTATMAVFIVVLDAPVTAYRPGQYVSLGVERGGELVQRPYSIVSVGMSGTRVELLVRRLPDGRLSNLLWALPAGARLRVGPPRGLFVLDADHTRPRLMVGTGTGVAPLLAMLADSAARRDAAPNVLIHGVSYWVELAYGERIAGWAAAGLPIDYRPTVSRPHERRNSGWSGPVGRAEMLLAQLLAESALARGGVAYLCGNPEMIESCRRILLAAGVAPADIRAEQFHAPLPPRFA
jgi:phenol/toluene 2-monooxygenase (NADH) P5/A5